MMRRVLTFDGDTAVAESRFRVIYEGFILGGTAAQARPNASGVPAGRSMEERRVVSGIARALHAVSDGLVKDGKALTYITGDRKRQLVMLPAVVVLTVVEYNVLVTFVTDPALPWPMDASEAVIDAVDFLVAAPQIEAND
jgi:hypothetical protein